MMETSQFNDICITCNFGPTCVRRKRHGKPVLFCEEFDDYQAPVIDKSPLVSEWGKKSEAEKNILNGIKGLCANCECLTFCSVPKNGGGIWHCEEYR